MATNDGGANGGITRHDEGKFPTERKSGLIHTSAALTSDSHNVALSVARTLLSAASVTMNECHVIAAADSDQIFMEEKVATIYSVTSSLSVAVFGRATVSTEISVRVEIFVVPLSVCQFVS